MLFDERGRVKLADFGVSGNSLDPGTDSMVRGLSPFTASPEQLRGEPPRPSDDIYGLGALAYELLSRYPPHYPHFDAQRVQQEPVPPLVPAQQIPPQLAALVSAMLAKDPALRPANMRDVIDELDASLNDTLTFDFETDEPPREGAANETVPPQAPAALPPISAQAASPLAVESWEPVPPEPVALQPVRARRQRGWGGAVAGSPRGAAAALAPGADAQRAAASRWSWSPRLQRSRSAPTCGCRRSARSQHAARPVTPGAAGVPLRMLPPP